MKVPYGRQVMRLLGRTAYGGGCHGETLVEEGYRKGKVIILGNPNVGKSVIFNNLTGARVTVANYPGTTVAISKGKATIDGREFEVMDTPGMYSLLPITGEELVARSILLKEHPDAGREC